MDFQVSNRYSPEMKSVINLHDSVNEQNCDISALHYWRCVANVDLQKTRKFFRNNGAAAPKEMKICIDWQRQKSESPSNNS